jgi:hypothetical protein
MGEQKRPRGGSLAKTPEHMSCWSLTAFPQSRLGWIKVSSCDFDLSAHSGPNYPAIPKRPPACQNEAVARYTPMMSSALTVVLVSNR